MLGLYQGGRSVVDSDSERMAGRKSLAPARSAHRREQDDAGPHRRLFPDRSISACSDLCCWQGACARCNERRGGMINLSYGNGRTVRVPKGLSVLEASLRNNVPHASVCGGRARCSTCRIRVIGDCSVAAGALAARGVRAQPGRRRADPAIRLACQLRPETDLSFFQLFLPQTTAADVRDLESDPHRRGALSRQHVRRHARLDQACGKAAAVRHRLHRQPLPRRGVAGGDRMRRPAQPVRRRRHAGAVRARHRTGANRLPPGAAGRGA